MFKGRFWHSITRVNNKIYSAGGIGSPVEALKSLEIYSLSKIEWSPGPQMKIAGLVSLITIENRFIYSIGGSKDGDSSHYISKLYIQRLDTNSND